MDRRIDPRFAPPLDWRARLRRRRRSLKVDLYLSVVHVTGVALLAAALPDLEWWRIGLLSVGVGLIAIVVSND